MRKFTSTCLVLLVAGCASVDVTKTGKGIYAETNPNDVEIIHTKPDQKFVELGSVSTNGWAPGDTASMHNALRQKAGPLGANAVLILNSGMVQDGWNGLRMWSTGAAIRYEK